MPAPSRSISNPALSTRQQPRAKPRPVPARLNNELSIDTTSTTTSMGPQPRPKPHLIPAPLNERLSIDTTSPMTSIRHPRAGTGRGLALGHCLVDGPGLDTDLDRAGMRVWWFA